MAAIRLIFKYFIGPALAFLGGRIVIVVLESAGVNVVALVDRWVPEAIATIDRGEAILIATFVFAVPIYLLTYRLLFWRGATPTITDQSATAPEDKWLPFEHAFRFFRDAVKDKGEVAGVLDFWDSDGHGYFLSYMRDGINQGFVSARGVPKNGLGVRDVPTPVKDSIVEHTAGDDYIIGDNGREYRNLEFNKDSLARYAEWLESDNELEPEASLGANQRQARDTERLENLQDAVFDFTTATQRVALMRPTQVSEDWVQKRTRLEDTAGRVRKHLQIHALCADLVNRANIVLDDAANRENWRPALNEMAEIEKGLLKEIEKAQS